MAGAAELAGRGTKARDWWALVETMAVFGAVMAFIWWFRREHPTSWLIIFGYVIGSHITHRETPRRLGFGWANAKAAFPLVLVWASAISAAIVAAGAAFGTLRPVSGGQIAAGIAAYTLWGLFQQYILNGYFVNRLAQFGGDPRSRTVAFGAAMFFALAHLPNWFLVLVTFVGGYVSARVFLAYRSLYPLALAHGTLGYLLLLAAPPWLAVRFLIGPRYFLEMYGRYPSWLAP